MNPWKKILLSDYENHMSLESVAQLQALNRIMKEQFCIYEMLRKKTDMMRWMRSIHHCRMVNICYGLILQNRWKDIFQ